MASVQLPNEQSPSNRGIQLSHGIRPITTKIRNSWKKPLHVNGPSRRGKTKTCAPRKRCHCSMPKAQLEPALDAKPVSSGNHRASRSQSLNLIQATVADSDIQNVRSARSNRLWDNANDAPACIEMATDISDSASCGTRSCMPKPLGRYSASRRYGAKPMDARRSTDFGEPSGLTREKKIKVLKAKEGGKSLPQKMLEILVVFHPGRRCAGRLFNRLFHYHGLGCQEQCGNRCSVLQR